MAALAEEAEDEPEKNGEDDCACTDTDPDTYFGADGKAWVG